MNNPTYIDIFAGCGGLSLGFYNAGYNGVFAIEKNKDAFSTLEYNLINNKNHYNWPDWLPLCEHDINELLSNYLEELTSLKGKIQVVAGGPPCQGFSMAGKRIPNDQRNRLVKSYVKFIRIIQPEAVIFENVHGFTVKFKQKNGKEKVYSNYIINALRRAGYKTDFRIITMSDFGVPQSRKRFILVAFKNHNPKSFFDILFKNRNSFLTKLELQIPITASEAISDLEKINGTVASPDTKNFLAGIYGPVTSPYQALMRRNNRIEPDAAVDSHRFVNHSKSIIDLHNALLHIDSIKGKYTSGGKRRKQEVPRYTQVGNAVPPLFSEQLGYALKEVLSNG